MCGKERKLKKKCEVSLSSGYKEDETSSKSNQSGNLDKIVKAQNHENNVISKT